MEKSKHLTPPLPQDHLSRNASTNRINLITIICGLLLLFVFLLSARTVLYISETTLDSDTSSDLVLAEHLAKTNQLISNDWIYSTEIHVFDNQLIYSLLFRLTDNWRLVRIGSTLIQQILMILSYFFLCKKAHLSLNSILFTGSLLLLPINVAYGRIVLYHGFYPYYFIMSFLVVGLLIGVLDNRNKHVLIDYVALLAVSFLFGLKGVRPLLLIYVPIMFIYTIQLFHRIYTHRQSFISKETLHMMAIPTSALLFCLLGFWGNCRLSNTYLFSNYKDVINWEIIPVSEWPELLRGILYQFGFRSKLNVLSFIGILSGCAIICAIWAFFQSGKALLINTDYNQGKILLEGFFVASFGITIFAFIFAYDSSYYYLLYLIPCAAWIFPLLASCLDQTSIDQFISNARGFFPIICAFTFLCNGFLNLFWFSDDIYINQPYEGLYYQDAAIVSSLSNAADYLTEHNLTTGYATFWHANVLTEMTNGRVRVVSVKDVPDFPVFYDWLTFKTAPTSPNGLAFLLLNKYEDNYTFEDASKVYDDGLFIIYQFDEKSIQEQVFRLQ